jgi:hypothetical protein
MRNIKIIAFALLIGLLSFGYGWAVDHVEIPVTVTVPLLTPDFQTILYIVDGWDPGQVNNPWNGDEVLPREHPVFNFPELTHYKDPNQGGGEAGQFYCQKYFCLFIFASGFGSPYLITQTGSYLTSGANTLPQGSFGVTPGYSDQDEWSPGRPQGSIYEGVIGLAQMARTPNSLIYHSAPDEARDHIIRAFYSIPPYPMIGEPWLGYEPIRTGQFWGTYTGTVTITIAPYQP